ncbi:MAG: hypothetical protein QOH19_2307 [Actinomycetota bacterium]|nr:hypothetical protein [Actinomycetota bacterium]
MTENNWPQDGSQGIPTATQQTPPGQASTLPPAPGAPATGGTTTGGTTTGGTAAGGTASKTDAAKEQTAEVTRQAKDAAQNVAETAKSETAHVASEVKTNAKDLLYRAKSDLTEQTSTQQQKVAEGLRSISDELRTMASSADQPGVASDLARQAAERSSAIASWLEARDPGSLLNEVKSFARQRPGAFLMLAAGAGVLAGRLTRSLAAPEANANRAATGTHAVGTAPISGVPDTGMAVPPPPVQMPGPDTTTAGLAGTYPPNPLATEGTSEDQWPADPGATDPYRSNPVRDDPFDGGRR